MSDEHYYIPRKDAAFNIWFKNLCQYVTQKCAGSSPAWNHIPQAELAKLNAAYAGWYTAYSATFTPHSPVETRAKDDARKQAESVIKPFKRRFLDDPPVTDEDRVAMSIHIKDTTRTPDSEPDTYPVAEKIDTSTIRQITIPFKDSGAANRAKPHGIHGAELRWAMLDHPPASVAELINSEFDTASPITLKFGEADRSRWVYFCFRWESKTGLKGPWGEIYSAIIP